MSIVDRPVQHGSHIVTPGYYGGENINGSREDLTTKMHNSNGNLQRR